MALRELGGPGLELWEEWSRESPHYTAGCCREKWGTFEPSGDDEKKVGLRSLFHWFREAHGRYPWEPANDDGGGAGGEARRGAGGGGGGGGGLATIIGGTDTPGGGLKKGTPQPLTALAPRNRPEKGPRLFQRDGTLCRLRPGDAEGPPTIQRLVLDALRGEL